MTRYNYFNYMYPDEAKKIDQGFAEAMPAIWNAFTKVTGLNRFFSFTPAEITNNPAKDQAQGTLPKPAWYSDEINL